MFVPSKLMSNCSTSLPPGNIVPSIGVLIIFNRLGGNTAITYNRGVVVSTNILSSIPVGETFVGSIGAYIVFIGR